MLILVAPALKWKHDEIQEGQYRGGCIAREPSRTTKPTENPGQKDAQAVCKARSVQCVYSNFQVSDAVNLLEINPAQCS